LLTTQEAADLLNVSHSYLITLLTEGKIQFLKIDVKQYILAKDILGYKASIDKKRFKALKALTKQAQKLHLGYE
jgi:excisionase family DNA binding protein